MPSEAQLRALVDLRIMVVIDHPKLYEESAGQQNWGYVESFDDETFIVKLEEGVFHYWIFPNEAIDFCEPFNPGDKLLLTGMTPGYRATAIRGPNSGDLVRELKAQYKRTGHG